jgi:hypothetical protein
MNCSFGREFAAIVMTKSGLENGRVPNQKARNSDSATFN